MDQKAIAGIGNIYRSELLFFHSINPDVPARQLHEETVHSLWNTAVEWLNLGVKANSILTTLALGTTVPPRKKPSESVAIYKKHHCPRCGSAVTQYSVRQRTVYVCRTCQTKTQ